MSPRPFTGTTLVMAGPGSVAVDDFGGEVGVGVGVDVAVDFEVGVSMLELNSVSMLELDLKSESD